MKSDHKKTPTPILLLRLTACTLAAGVLFACMEIPAYATSLSGDSTTILRGRESTANDDLYPLYEYLTFSAADTTAKGTTSFNASLWGRVDLADRSTAHYTNGDVRYGFLTFQGNRNNLVFSAGRQFLNAGFTSELLDGLYLKSDLGAGFTAAAFVGAPAYTEPSFHGGDLLYGTRVSHTLSRFYTLGITYLRDDAGGRRLREEEGVDLWVYPLKQVDIIGHSSYDSITHGWMEHSYTISVTPIPLLRVTGDVAHIDYRNYFHHVTTSALSLTNGILLPQEEVLSYGGSVGLTPMNTLSIVADYRYYDYEIAGHANYFGGKLTFALPENLAAGVSGHRMDGDGDQRAYDEYRVFASKKLGKADITLDFIDIHFDSMVTGRTNTYSLAGAVGYDVTPRLRVAGDLDYSQNYFRNNELRGLVKVTYAFEVKSAAEGRATR